MLFVLGAHRLIGQTKNASHFSAWSSALLSHEEYRKSQVASGKSPADLDIDMDRHPSHMRSKGLTTHEGSRISDWVHKTQKTLSSVKSGEWKGVGG